MQTKAGIITQNAYGNNNGPFGTLNIDLELKGSIYVLDADEQKKELKKMKRESKLGRSAKKNLSINSS